MLLPLHLNLWRSRWRRGLVAGHGARVLELVAGLNALGRKPKKKEAEIAEAIRVVVREATPESITYTTERTYKPVSYLPDVQRSYESLAAIVDYNARLSRLLARYYERVAREMEDEEDAVMILLA